MRITWKLMLMLCTVFVFAACGSSETSAEDEAGTETTAEELPRVLANGTNLLDLSDYYLPFSLYVPDSTKGYPEVIETGYGETIVRVGAMYNMLIAEGGDVAAKKAEVMDDLMYTNTIVEEGDDYFLYKSEIKDSFLDPEFHFYAVKQINGITFEFRDNKDEGPYAESIARLMLESVKHVQANQAAS
jgi:hypothetical protein